ncbi:MAG: PepSY-associated TM helix domain-containing protein [Pseudomonadota bacterium]
MSMVDQAKSKRLLAVHGWSGMILGLLLYLVVLTGAIAVLAHEIGSWSTGSAGSHDLDPNAATAVSQLASEVPEEWKDEVRLYTNMEGNTIANFHTHQENPASGQIEDYGGRFVISKDTGEVISRTEGYNDVLYPTERGSALEGFITELHINLHLPNPWGLYATGILGLVLMAAAISGLILHKHLFRDMFVSPRFSSMLLNKRDRHILAGTWSLPFAFILAFTGAFFSFIISIGFPIILLTGFGGDIERATEMLTPKSPLVEDASPAPIQSLDQIYADLEARTGSAPTNANIVNLGRADSMIVLYAAASDGAVLGANHAYSVADGSYLGEQPLIGSGENNAAGIAFGLMGALHFGNFAGLLSKSVWVALGLAMCYVNITGMRMWTQRRLEDRLWQRFDRVTTIFTYGVPLTMATSAMGFFATYNFAGDTMTGTVIGFFTGTVLAFALGLRRIDELTAIRSLTAVLVASMLVLPIMRIATGGPGWINAITSGSGMIVTMDLLLLITAGAFAHREFGPIRLPLRAAVPIAEPAE